MGGGIECGKQPTMPEAFSQVSGFRPCVMDARGEYWNKDPVRGFTSDTAAMHAAKGVQHMYFEMNWLMKGGTRG